MTKTTPAHVSRAEFDQLFQAVKNWGRWGPEDEKGTLNYISPEHVRRAAELVHSGRSVSLEIPINMVAGPDNPRPATHYMVQNYYTAFPGMRCDKARRCGYGNRHETRSPRAHGTVHSGTAYSQPRVIPTELDLARAAEVLNAGEKVAMLVGAGALHATDEVIAVADLLGAGVAKALLGKAALPDDLPYVTGSIGLLGTKPSYDLMMDCDTLLMVGTSFPYSEFLPKEGQARGVQIDIDGRMLGFRYPTEVNLVGDSAETLRALIPRLERKAERSWRERIEKGVADWWKLLEAKAMDEADPINPQRVFWELSPRLPENCILAADSGSVANWFARDLKIRSGMMASLSGNLATMGPGVPYAIAAKFAFPERVAIALVGDGAMQMNGNNGLITVSKYWRQWADPRLIVLVLHNNDLNQVTWEQRALAGDPKFECSQNLPDFPYAQYAELLGLKGILVDRPEAVGAAWDEALSADRPAVIDAITDPDVPPIPPHITFEQAKAYASALFKGDPNERGIIRQTFREIVDVIMPHGN